MCFVGIELAALKGEVTLLDYLTLAYQSESSLLMPGVRISSPHLEISEWNLALRTH